MTAKTKLTLAWIGSLLVVVLMALPIGVAQTFALDGGETYTRLYAYFNPAVLGMSGNMLPFTAAVLSAVTALLLTLKRFWGKTQLVLAKYIAEIGLVAAVYSMLIYRTFSPAGCLTAVLQTLVCGLLISLTPKKKDGLSGR